MGGGGSESAPDGVQSERRSQHRLKFGVTSSDLDESIVATDESRLPGSRASRSPSKCALWTLNTGVIATTTIAAPKSFACPTPVPTLRRNSACYHCPPMGGSTPLAPLTANMQKTGVFLPNCKLADTARRRIFRNNQRRSPSPATSARPLSARPLSAPLRQRRAIGINERVVATQACKSRGTRDPSPCCFNSEFARASPSGRAKCHQ